MSAEKIFRMAFEINGMLGSSFNATMAVSKSKIKQFAETTKYVQREQKNLDRQMKAGSISVDYYRQSMVRLNAEMDKTRQEQLRLSQAMHAKVAAKAKFQAATSSASNTVATVSVMATPFMAALKVAADFEAKMSKVKAITGANNDEMKKLTETARHLGATTQFSATQSADAMSYLGQAGWNTTEPPTTEVAGFLGTQHT